MTPDAADAIEAGDRAPRRTRSTRARSRRARAIQLNEDYYPGIKAKATYRELQVEMGYDEGTRVSSGVKRIDARTVRVMVGDEDFVKQALEARRQGRRLERLARQHEGAQRRQAARGRHRHLDRGRLGRLPGLPELGQAARAGHGGHERPDAGRDDPLHGHHRARGQARRAHARRARFTLRRPLDLEPRTRDGSDRRTHQRPLQRHRPRVLIRGGRQRQPGRHAALLADAPRRAPLLHPDAVRAHWAEAAGRRPAEGPAARLHRGAARASCSEIALDAARPTGWR